MPTKYERDLIAKSTLAGLINAYYQPSIIFELGESSAGAADKLEVTADGRYAVSAQRDKTLNVWDISKNQLAWRLPQLQVPDVAISFESFGLSGDGKRLVTEDGVGNLLLWNVETGENIATNHIPNLAMYSLALNFDGTKVITQSSRDQITIWNTQNGSKIKSIKVDDNQIEKMRINKDDSKLIVIYRSVDKAVRIYDLVDGSMTQLMHESEIESAIFTPDARRIVSASREGIIKVWDSSSFEFMHSAHINPTNSSQTIRIDSTDTKIAVLAERSFITILELDGAREIKSFKNQSTDFINSISLSKDGSKIFTGSVRDPIKAWVIDGGESISTIKAHAQTITSAAITHDGTRLYTTSTTPEIKVWDTDTWSHLRTYSAFTSTPNYLTLSSDEKSVAFVTSPAQVMDLGTGTVTKTFTGHFKSVDSVAMSRDMKMLATGSHDFTVKIWDTETQKELFTLVNPDTSERVAFSPDGGKLLSVSGSDIYLWDTATGSKLYTIKRNASSVFNIAFFNDNKRFYSGSLNHYIRIMDTESGKTQKQIDTEKGVHKLFLSNDESIFVQVDPFGSILLWDVSTGEKLGEISNKHNYFPQSLNISANNKWLVTGHASGALKVWDLTHSGLTKSLCKNLKSFASDAICN